MIEWDNKKKHGVSFELASLVFDDPFHLTRYDRVEEGSGETIRIISARPATKRERKIYEQDK